MTFLLSGGTIGPEELWHREKIDGCYYSAHTMKKRVGSMSASWSKLRILSRVRKGEDCISGLNTQGMFWLGKVEKTRCRKSRASVLFSHPVLWKGCLDWNGTTQKRRVRIKRSVRWPRLGSLLRQLHAHFLSPKEITNRSCELSYQIFSFHP